jgi:hypothetical protein
MEDTMNPRLTQEEIALLTPEYAKNLMEGELYTGPIDLGRTHILYMQNCLERTQNAVMLEQAVSDLCMKYYDVVMNAPAHAKETAKRLPQEFGPRGYDRACPVIAELRTMNGASLDDALALRAAYLKASDLYERPIYSDSRTLNRLFTLSGTCDPEEACADTARHMLIHCGAIDEMKIHTFHCYSNWTSKYADMVDMERVGIAVTSVERLLTNIYKLRE